MAGYAQSLLLVLACGLVGYLGPLFFLEESANPSYLGTALSAAAGAGAIATFLKMGAPRVPVGLQGLAGAGAALLTWAPVTLIALFQILPLLAAGQFQRFDIVWIGSGLGPPVLLVLAYLRADGPAFGAKRLWSVMRLLYQYSLPLLGIMLAARALTPDKEQRWLALFTAILFMTLNLLATLRRPEEVDHAAVD